MIFMLEVVQLNYYFIIMLISNEILLYFYKLLKLHFNFNFEL